MEHQGDPNANLFDSHHETYSASVNDAVRFSGLNVDFFTRVKADYIRDLLRSHFEDMADVSMVDVGCGIGNFHGLLKHDLGALTGVDVSRDSIELASRRHPEVNYVHYDGSALPFPNESFDVSLAICVMHHVPPRNWNSFASEMMRVLRPGGLALVFEHNPANPLTRRVVDRCSFDADAVLLSRRTAIEVFKPLPVVAEVSTRCILTVPAGTSTLRHIDRIFSGLPIGAQYYLQATKITCLQDPV